MLLQLLKLTELSKQIPINTDALILHESSTGSRKKKKEGKNEKRNVIDDDPKKKKEHNIDKHTAP